MTLTAHQQRVLGYIRYFQQSRRYSPSLPDLAVAFGNRSHSGMQKTVNKLAAAGALQLSPTGRICFEMKKRRWEPIQLPVVTSGRCYLSFRVVP